jgi:hypothetical protein
VLEIPSLELPSSVTLLEAHAVAGDSRDTTMRSSIRVAAASAVMLGAANALFTNGSVTAPCDSPLYCQGEILKAIELASPFTDSKTYVDM